MTEISSDNFENNITFVVGIFAVLLMILAPLTYFQITELYTFEEDDIDDNDFHLEEDADNNDRENGKDRDRDRDRD